MTVADIVAKASSLRACIDNEAKSEGRQRHRDLQDECRKHGINHLGNIPVLKERLVNYFRNNMGRGSSSTNSHNTEQTESNDDVHVSFQSLSTTDVLNFYIPNSLNFDHNRQHQNLSKKLFYNKQHRDTEKESIFPMLVIARLEGYLQNSGRSSTNICNEKPSGSTFTHVSIQSKGTDISYNIDKPNHCRSRRITSHYHNHQTEIDLLEELFYRKQQKDAALPESASPHHEKREYKKEKKHKKEKKQQREPRQSSGLKRKSEEYNDTSEIKRKAKHIDEESKMLPLTTHATLCTARESNDVETDSDAKYRTKKAESRRGKRIKMQHIVEASTIPPVTTHATSQQKNCKIHIPCTPENSPNEGTKSTNRTKRTKMQHINEESKMSPITPHATSQHNEGERHTGTQFTNRIMCTSFPPRLCNNQSSIVPSILPCTGNIPLVHTTTTTSKKQDVLLPSARTQQMLNCPMSILAKKMLFQSIKKKLYKQFYHNSYDRIRIESTGQEGGSDSSGRPIKSSVMIHIHYDKVCNKRK